MCPASGPVQEPKQFPAAAMEDQEAIANGEQAVSFISTPPFSSPDPSTDGLKMEIVDSNVSAYDARENAAQAQDNAPQDYDSMKLPELKSLAQERDLTVEGTKKADFIAALREDDASDMKAADFKAQVDAATTQEELDAAAELYQASGKSYSSVEAAVEKKQEEINEAANGGGDGDES